METININLKRIRKEKNMSQEEFAEKLNVKRSTIGAYEEGRGTPGLQAIKSFAGALGVTKSRFYDFLYDKEFKFK